MVENAAFVIYVALALIFFGFFAVIVWMILKNVIRLDHLISEPDGKASLSRFQLLLFTFVVAGLFLVLSLEAGQFVEIPTGVQVLLGISGGSFVISKAVGTAKAPGDGAAAGGGG
jgi:hypothetical protein